MKQVIGKWCRKCKEYIPPYKSFCPCLMQIPLQKRMERHKEQFWQDAFVEVSTSMEQANGRSADARTVHRVSDWVPAD